MITVTYNDIITIVSWVALIVALAILGVKLGRKLGNKLADRSQRRAQAKAQAPEWNSLVVDMDKRTYQLEVLKEGSGRLWRYLGDPVYWMQRLNGHYSVVDVGLGINDNAYRLFRYLPATWKMVVEPLFTVKPTLMKKINAILTVILIGILCLTLYLIFSTATKGS